MKCSYGCGKKARYKLKNGKPCCEEYYNQCPASRKMMSKLKLENYTIPNPKTNAANKRTKRCRHCDKKLAPAGKTIHERSCYMNPKNLKLCPVCNKPIINFKENVTCGVHCAKIHFKEIYRKSYNKRMSSYKTICFHYHEKKCVVCGETKIIAAHHFDGNRKNNSPDNLVPLCPTHHAYWHSSFKYLILDKVKKYVRKFKKQGVYSFYGKNPNHRKSKSKSKTKK